jgi:hypothetical protein
MTISLGDGALAVRLDCTGLFIAAYRHVPITFPYFAKSDMASGAGSGNTLGKLFRLEELKASLPKPIYTIVRYPFSNADQALALQLPQQLRSMYPWTISAHGHPPEPYVGIRCFSSSRMLSMVSVGHPKKR